MHDEILKGIEDQGRVQNSCGHCGKGIIPDNDSGWECFLEGGTAPLCSDCRVKMNNITKKTKNAAEEEPQ